MNIARLAPGKWKAVIVAVPAVTVLYASTAYIVRKPASTQPADVEYSIKAIGAARKSASPAPGMPVVAGMARVLSPTNGSAGESVTKPVSWSTIESASPSRMVISTADAVVEVEDLSKAGSAVRDLCREAGGFVTKSNISNEGERREAFIAIRVPSGQYRTALGRIVGLGRVISEQEHGDDVTQEYVDLQSRMRNLNREEAAFLKVLDSAHKVEDILAVESELSRVRGEIEEATGRIKYLSNQVALSTIGVELREPAPVVADTVGWNMGQTASGAFNALKSVLRAITSAVIWIAVFTPIWVTAALAFRRLRGRRRAETQA